MRVVLDFYFDDLEQRCTANGCKFVIGPYDEEWHGRCLYCQERVGFFRAFGTLKERSIEVSRWDARISGIHY